MRKLRGFRFSPDSGSDSGSAVLYRWSHLEMNLLTTCTQSVSLSACHDQSSVSSDQSWLVKPMGGFNLVIAGRFVGEW